MPYSYGWRSSRKIERALHHNLSFIWLSGGLKPDFKTISTFRRDNMEGLKNVLVQSARLCLKFKLIEGNTLFTDGSKFRANAGNRETKTLSKWERYKEHVFLIDYELILRYENNHLIVLNNTFENLYLQKINQVL